MCRRLAKRLLMSLGQSAVMRGMSGPGVLARMWHHAGDASESFLHAVAKSALPLFSPPHTFSGHFTSLQLRVFSLHGACSQ